MLKLALDFLNSELDGLYTNWRNLMSASLIAEEAAPPGNSHTLLSHERQFQLSSDGSESWCWIIIYISETVFNIESSILALAARQWSRSPNPNIS